MSVLIENFQEFIPTQYIHEYYSEVGSENRELLKFFSRVYSSVPKGSKMLEFGGGPGIYSLISASKYVSEIHFSDYLQTNLDAVKSWKQDREFQTIWRPFFHEALSCEGLNIAKTHIVQMREEILRTKLTQFHRCDAFQANPLGHGFRKYYDVVAANFVAESITTSRNQWEKIISNIISLLKPDGTLIMTSIQEAKHYSINSKYFPAVSVKEIDLVQLLIQEGFHPEKISVYSIPAEIQDEKDVTYKGYKGMIFLRARK